MFSPRAHFLGAACLLVLSSYHASGAKPDVPQDVAMTANAADSVTLSWSAPAGADVKSYNLYVSDKKEGDFKKAANVTTPVVTHRGLKPGTDYLFKVSAVNQEGESAQSAVSPAFTITPSPGAPFLARIAKNMCVSLGAKIISTPVPISGKLADLVDGSDATSCRLRKACEIKIELKDTAAFADAAYLMLHFRTQGGPADWSNDPQARALRSYVVIESLDSKHGTDGTWTEVATGTNELLDGVIVLPNHKPRWIGIRSTSTTEIAASDKRPQPTDLMLSRLDVFRSAPEGQRNDFWIFTGDSLVVQDLPAGGGEGRTAWFSDSVRRQHPDRYPIVVHTARGGEMLKDTLPRMEKLMPALSPTNATNVPTATFVCWESGFNDVGLSAGLWIGTKIIESLTKAQELCMANGLFIVPVRIEFATAYLDPATLQPAKPNVFHNTLAANLAGVDVFCRTRAPYACNPATQLPFADYWTYIKTNHATALAKDGVHHTKAGSDGINQLWAEVAGKMIYSKQR